MTSTIQKTFLVLLLILITINIALAATKTFRGEETDFFKLSPETFDLDGDQVTVTYSEPFDEQGEWQTTYGDAGEYRVIITASDGQEETTDEVLFIVSKKNRAPEIIEPKLAVKESQKVSLRDAVRDPDDDPLTFQFQPPFNQQGEWQTGYDDEGIIVTQFSVSDGEFTTQGRVEVQVLPTNQPPIITSTFSTEKKLDVTEGDTLGFSVEAEDRDGDAITYAWFIDDDLITERAQGQYHFDFESAGEHTLKVIVNDGTRESSREWEITVRNVNREPAFSIQPITVNEGERAELKFPTQDLDGDALSYTFEKPLVDGKWQTGFEDAGTHRVTVTATDGEFTKRQDVIITVLDVDRPPSLTLPSSLLAKEGETLEWGIVTEDPDGDVVTISIENMPDGAVLHQRSKTFLWNLDYDAIQRKGGFWSDLLSAVRLEKYFLKEKTIPLTVKVCGKDLCNEGEVVLYVKNVNQNPIINPLDDVRVIETEEVSLNASGSDPDGDIVRFSYTDPVNHNGEWKTGYEDEGTYTVFVTASDGQGEDTIPVEITVDKKDRAPSLDINYDDVTVNEGEEFTVRVTASDPDNDPLELRVTNLPTGAEFQDGAFVWNPNYDTVMNSSAGWFESIITSTAYTNKKFSKQESVVWLEFIGSDGELEVVHPVKITIKNVNRAPEIVRFSPVDKPLVKIGEPVLLEVDAIDRDGDELTYEWNFGLGESKLGGTTKVERIFVSPGLKKVTLTISDGEQEVEHTFSIRVSNERVAVTEPISEAVDPYEYRVYIVDHNGVGQWVDPFESRTYVIQH